MLKVVLLSKTINSQKTVAAAAKLCYSNSNLDDLYENLTDQQAEKFVDMLTEIGHESPIEHAYFTFGIEGVSRALLAQFTRHRIASYSVQSQRYVEMSGFEYILPPEINEEEEARKEFQQAMAEAVRHYENITEILKQKHEKDFLSKGFNEKSAAAAAEKKAIEDARFVLPNAAATKLIVTMNARSLKNFFRHRLCQRAQWEIRLLAEKMLDLLLVEAPQLFNKCSPTCVYGNCPEGKMSCGNAADIKAYYNNKKLSLIKDNTILRNDDE